MSNIAFCLLTRVPSVEWIQFLTEIAKYTKFNVMIICDDNTYVADKDLPLRVIQYDNKILQEAGYRNACYVTITKDITAWDKAIYHLCEVETDYDYAYLIEDDVFIPSIRSIVSIQEKYVDEDLICHCDNGFFEKDNGNIYVWHWRHAYNRLELPWYASMVCAIRVSNKLLKEMKQHIRIIKEIPFIEIAWNTIAHQKNLKVRIIPEFKYIVYNPISLNYKEYKEYLQEGNWLHPIKEIKDHDRIREELNIKNV
ncbi:MAG: hypothetical protein ACO27D_02620 [Candidatus Fonsibacter ubiquis]